jgi:hypothetical protein
VFHNGARSRFNAWFFQAFDRYINHIAARHKSGGILRHRPPVASSRSGPAWAPTSTTARGSTIVAVEPNLAMHDSLRRRAEEHGVDLELIGAGGERLPLPMRASTR